MLKKIIVLTFSLMLMSCQENSKIKIQELINKKDFVNAKVLVENKLGQNPQDDYYNGAMGYILAIECSSKNCVENNPENLKKIKYYLKKSTSLAKVDDVYFVDFYQKIIEEIVELAGKQTTLQSARLTLKEFVNQTNHRTAFIYQQLYKNALKALLKEDLKAVKLNLSLIQEFNFRLTKEEKSSVDLLLSLGNNLPLQEVKGKLRNFNRTFIGSKLPNEFLVFISPALARYALDNKLENISEAIENSTKTRSTIFGENVAALTKRNNVKAYAAGIELITKSPTISKNLALHSGFSEQQQTIILQNLSLRLNSDNAELWQSYLKNVLNNGEISELYQNIKIETIPANIVIANNDLILNNASSVFKEKSITSILDEMVFREDSNKDAYTAKTIELVKKALQHEITKNNLDGIFEYLNYVPSIKGTFKSELNQRLNEYIDLAWDTNDFENLNKLISLHRDLNETSDNSILVNLLEQYLLNEENIQLFTANSIKELINQDIDEDKDLAAKYDFIIGNLRNEEIQTTLFSVARKEKGIYSQAKLFGYFAEIFSKEKVDDLIIDSVVSALEKDQNKSLNDLIKLANFIMFEANKLPENYIANEIIPNFKTLENITTAWSNASVQTKDQLVAYNADIKNLISVVENDKANKKITASTYIGKIKSKEFSPFVEKYKKIYKSYVNQIKGYYIKNDQKKGAEIIKISPTDKLLQINIEFISRLGNIESLDKYKLDRGQVITKYFKTYYNPVTSSVKIKGKYSNKELKVFNKATKLLLDGKFLMLNDKKYHKVNKLFSLNKRYGIVQQVTEKTQDNFHILPEGSSFVITKDLGNNAYNINIKHPAMVKNINTVAKYNPQTAEFSFTYNYNIKLFAKTFSAKAKCQVVDKKAQCTVQDKYWKRQEYSVILNALEVK